MRRRKLLQSAGGALLGMLGHGIVPALASEADDAGVARDSVTLFLGGDVMTGRGIDQVLPHPSDPALAERGAKSALDYVALAEAAHGPIPRGVDFDYIWGDALAVLEELGPDLRIVNLETAVTRNPERWKTKSIHFRMHPENVGCLTAAGIDCCALANNHALDFAYAGLAETLATLREAGIHNAGAGQDIEAAGAPAILPLGGNRRLLLYSLATRDSGVSKFWVAAENKPGINEMAEYRPYLTQPVLDRIREDKRPGDLVVASIHWGGNWGYTVPGVQRKFARALVQAGVDVIHGHSSHHPKGIEVIDGRPVIYGCGDLINDYEGISNENDRYRGELALMYFVTLDRASGALQRLEMRPMRIRNFRLNHASAEEAGWLAEQLQREGRKLGTSVAIGEHRALSLQWQPEPRA